MTDEELKEKAILAFKKKEEKKYERIIRDIQTVFPIAVFLPEKRKFKLCGIEFDYNFSESSNKYYLYYQTQYVYDMAFLGRILSGQAEFEIKKTPANDETSIRSRSSGLPCVR